MLQWVIKGVIAGAVAGVAYVAGKRRGGREVARAMVEDREVGRQVLERLASVHGATLDLFEFPAAGDGGPAAT